MQSPPTANASNPQPQRPTSAPNPRVRLRQYNQLVQQLQNTVAETKRPPPAGADIEAITARRTKLERVLRDVQESIAATKREQKDHQDGRFKKATLDQISKEQKFVEELAAAEDRSKQQSNYYWSLTMKKRRDLNEKIDKRTNDAFNTLHNRQVARERNNKEETEKMQTKLEVMAEKQSQARAASAKQRQQIREHTEQLYQRKLENDALRQKQREEEAQKRKSDWERRMKLVQEKKNQRAQSTDTHRAVAKQKGTFDFEKAQEEMNQRELEQQLRYAQEQRIRQAERMRKKQLDEEREKKRESNYYDLSDKHAQTRDEIKKKIQDQTDHVAAERRQLEQRMLNRRIQRNHSIVEHQQKSTQRREAKVDAGFQSNYTRWTRRADHVMKKIIGSYEALNSPEREKQGGEAGETGGEHQVADHQNNASAADVATTPSNNNNRLPPTAPNSAMKASQSIRPQTAGNTRRAQSLRTGVNVVG